MAKRELTIHRVNNPAKRTRKNRVEDSPAIMEQHLARRKKAPIVLTGIGRPKRIDIGPELYRKLDVDAESYQRNETDIIGDIVAALVQGGQIVDPVWLSKRTWLEDGKLWIVDGLQRTTAAMKVNHTFPADVYECSSLEQEKKLFLVANTRVAVSPNRIVKAWSGPSGALLRAIDQTPGHPLYGKIAFEHNASASGVQSTVLVRALCHFLGLRAASKTSEQLGYIDQELVDERSRARASQLLRLIGLIWPKGYIKVMPVKAIATVARERWAGKGTGAACEIPAPNVLARLAKIPYETLVPSNAARFDPILAEAVRKVWKVAE